MLPLAVYIHIPYCEHKCIYCDFYSVINGKNTAEYFAALRSEIELRAEEFADKFFIDTIFFGGGTPSLVPSKYIRETINLLHKKFRIAEKPEITLEANPGTLDAVKIKELLASGVNRLSVGVQSFFDDDLKFLTRIHDSETAVATIEKASAYGFENINVDLIFNLPKQTEERWKTNLARAVALPVTHISAYSLIIERGTIIYKMIADGKTEIGDEDYDANLYEITQEFLEANGFAQYEVSNFAKENYKCRHNLAYWRYRDYIGFGTAAHSFVNPRRWKNFTSLTYYLKSARRSENPFVASEENLSEKERLEEYVMLALRSEGLNLSELRQRFGEKFITDNKKLFDELAKNDFISFNENVVKFTRKGYALCDEILLRLSF